MVKYLKRSVIEAHRPGRCGIKPVGSSSTSASTKVFSSFYIPILNKQGI